ncbi:amidohydrolase [Janibacter sp. G1551]|uniref:amidohydrolase n=1 Tax=Janibacter sp. G1551 TaxID=3420440 RepID=UPI003CFBF713
MTAHPERPGRGGAASAPADPPRLVRGVRLVPVAAAGAGAPQPVPDHPVDLRLRGGVVTEVGPGLRAEVDEEVLDGEGRWAAPGLWDAHVHMVQWVKTAGRLDVSASQRPEDVVRILTDHLASGEAGNGFVFGWGYRSAVWDRQPTVAELDAASPDRPVVMISGDVHNGWLNTRALELLGLGGVDGVGGRTGTLQENEWFDALPRLEQLAGASGRSHAGVESAVRAAAARGVVGMVDMEFGTAHTDWPDRVAAGITQLRVRTATYAATLADVIASGWRTGDPIPGGAGLITMGPLKIIGDGSLNTRTACCTHPYADASHLDLPRGRMNQSPEELRRLLSEGTAAGLEVALHAIGDAALTAALDAFEATGARGSIEHAQLVDLAQIPRMARLGIRASVQPWHLIDDRDVTEQCWPDHLARCFPFASLHRAGVALTLGSDAPVAPLDPWRALAAAVHRSDDERDPWNPAEALTAAQALAASTDGAGTLGVGSRADLILLDADPLAPQEDSRALAAHLRDLAVATTLVEGRVTHDAR